MTVGDILWVQLPAANDHEQRGHRLVVVLQDDQYAGGLPVVLVAPPTTARATLRFAGSVAQHDGWAKGRGFRVDRHGTQARR
jgi:mRNA-degrading endonuclease toxin of MazEF toxin-antitoxin module